MSSNSEPWPLVSVVAVSVALVAAYVALGVASIAVFPTVGVDEAWYTQSAWSFATNGTFELPMFGDLAGFDRENVVYGRVYLLLMAVAYWIADVNVTAIKAVSLVSGLIALAAVIGIGRELWDRRVGAVAAVLLAVAPNFVSQSHDARPEIMLVAFWTVAFYLVLSGDRLGTRWRLAAGGLLAGLAVGTHLNGAAFPLALLLVLLIRRSSREDLAFYLVGLFVAFVWWIWVHVLPDPSLFRDQTEAFSTSGIPLFDVISRPLRVFALEIGRYVLVLPRASVLLVWVAALAIVVLLRHYRDRSLLCLLVLAATVFLFMALIVPHKIHLYAVLAWPIFALLVARLLSVSSRRVAISLGSVLVVVSLLSVGSTTWDAMSSDYDRYIERLRTQVAPGATVQADPLVWFGFADHPFIATHYFALTDSYEDAVRRLGIDYVVLDLPTLGSCPSCPYSTEVREFLEDGAELVAVVEDPFYGSFVADDGDGFKSPVYRIDD